MKTYLVTGGAGFIGSNFVLYMLEKYKDITIVNVDKLTYAGNLENLKSIEGDKRHVFVQADICDREAITALFGQYDFDFVINFAAESHVDRSIENPQLFLMTNILGTQNLLDAARRAWVTGKDENGIGTASGPRAKSICRSPRTRCTAAWARQAISWRPLRWTPTAPTPPARRARTCS